MAKVRYECTTPPHNKWWEIEYDEDMHGYTTWWGKIGYAASGSKPKRFQQRWRCEAAYGGKIQEKINKDYHFVGTLIGTVADFSGENPVKEKRKEPERNQFDVFGKM